MFGMEVSHFELIALALFVASELIGMSRLKSNSLLQIVLSTAMRAFPYKQKPKAPANPLDIFRR
jgi:hypothetical protein